MLKLRVLTAAALAPLFVLGVLFLPNALFAALIGGVALVGAWEWTHLSGYDDNQLKISAVAVVLALMVVGYGYRGMVDGPVFAAASIIWLLVAVALLRRRHRSPLVWPNPVLWVSGAWALVPAWLGLTVVQDSSPQAALLLFALIWAADTGAYFAGRRWGRRKLAPAISPGKTVEGVLGAMPSALLVAAAFGWYWGMSPAGWLGLIVAGMVVAVSSIFGDLFESNLKRLAKLKDSSNLLPGHGGVLDRIDSITSAAPFFALGWLWWLEPAAA